MICLVTELLQGSGSSPIKNKELLGLLGSPVVKTELPLQGDVGSIPGRGTKIPHAVRRGQKKNKRKKESGVTIPTSRAIVKIPLNNRCAVPGKEHVLS